ncbi:hypothetical protein WCN91_09265 [Pseudoalteromonas sp. YIC-827]|uniref:DUF4340 domain-containing protein n=1 Tax=Pseudoalteromonas qingdaonensis TaxID=3131913 RepID=A0ABU9MZ03_9GAMM
MAVIKLSRKAWNNLLIFSMLIMIFVFNGLHHKLGGNSEPEGPQPLLPEQSYILALEYPGVRIERIGSGWRLQGLPEAGAVQVDVAELATRVQAWQSMQAEPGTPSKSEPLLVATLSLAGEAHPWVFVLYRDAQQYQLFNKHEQRWLRLTQAQAQQLFLQLEG